MSSAGRTSQAWRGSEAALRVGPAPGCGRPGPRDSKSRCVQTDEHIAHAGNVDGLAIVGGRATNPIAVAFGHERHRHGPRPFRRPQRATGLAVQRPTESGGAERPSSLGCIQFSPGSEPLVEWRWPAAFRLDSLQAFYYKHAFRGWVCSSSCGRVEFTGPNLGGNVGYQPRAPAHNGCRKSGCRSTRFPTATCESG